MRLYFARHGNTFDPGDKIVWVGAREDLPLSASGRDQADAIGRAIAASGVRLGRAVSGPLQRTRETAERALDHLAGSVALGIDERLTEIDYGPWGGLSDEEIAARGEGAALMAWSEDGVWPEGGLWSTQEAEFATRIEAFLAEAAQGEEDALIVTSNGVLRYVRRAIDGLSGAPAKVRTGRLCALAAGPDGLVIEAWNAAPDDVFSGA